MKTQRLASSENRSQTSACIGRLLLPLALGLFVTGCLSRPALVRQNFALHCSGVTNKVTPPGQAVLAIRTLQVSPLFESRSFVYRTGANSYETDPYAGFMVAPSRGLGIPMRDCLRSSGAFKDVVEPGSQLAADTFLEVHNAEIYGDFRQKNQIAAVLSMHLIFFESVVGKPPRLLLEKEYLRRVPIPQQNAQALVAGWNQALAEMMTEVASDVASARGVRL